MREPIKRYIRTAQTFFPWLPDLKSNLQDQLSRVTGQPLEPDFLALRLFGGEGRLHLDVGANRGQSIAAIRAVASKPRVISFEPNPRLAAALLRRFSSLPAVRIEPVGLAQQDGVFDLHVPSYRGYIFDGLASFSREEAMSWLNPSTIVAFDSARLGCETLRCRVTMLDSFGLDPFFAKLDVQGYELQVLMGGAETLRRSAPVLLIEAPSEEVQSYLRQFGYRPYRYDDRLRRFKPGAGGQNTFFMTAEKAALVSSHIDGAASS
jgi:FkbM family methyltransferase